MHNSKSQVIKNMPFNMNAIASIESISLKVAVTHESTLKQYLRRTLICFDELILFIRVPILLFEKTTKCTDLQDLCKV